MPAYWSFVIVSLVCSCRRGAGTDCKVFMMIFGDKKASGQIILENSPENFTRGKVDSFMVDLPEMGERKAESVCI